LEGEPIEARRDTLYLARRLVRRTGPAAALGATLVLAAVLGAAIVYLLMNARIETLEREQEALLERLGPLEP
ncbi:MAG: hypothetical protein AAFU70_02090, partial [Planctomycetota bacterium]